MEIDPDGFRRPVRRADSAQQRPGAARLFAQVCPGRRVSSSRPPGSVRHPMLGPLVGVWEAWAAEPEMRYRGSSGGVLTALAAWLTEIGEVTELIGAAAERSDPRRTVSVSITDRDSALRAAGSRYAPVSVLAHANALQPGTGLIGKPCEASAARALLTLLPARDDARSPVLLSFFCAGTPSQRATEQLVGDLGLAAQVPLRRLWYRGRGWPGRFTAEATDGRRVSASYDESWGRTLGPAVQWRCKICPDGVGESSDISAADYWDTDDRGYPTFTEDEGRSAVLARTARGQELLERAFAAGVLIGRPLDPERLAMVQPLQVTRRTRLIGRLLGSILAGRPVPRYRSFGLLRLGWSEAADTVRTAVGTYRRVRQDRSR
jgi:coenzyme F420 hydrogenase subunit beta